MGDLKKYISCTPKKKSFVEYKPGNKNLTPMYVKEKILSLKVWEKILTQTKLRIPPFKSRINGRLLDSLRSP